MLVVIEGRDYVGKTTQAKMLLDRFNRIGSQVKFYSFPRYETATGKLIKEFLTKKDALKSIYDVYGFQYLHIADKFSALSEMSTVLYNRYHVVCCRWWPSVAMYGEYAGLGHHYLDVILEPLKCFPANEIIPSLKILLDAPVSLTQSLIRDEHKDFYDKDVQMQHGLRDLYLGLWHSKKVLKDESYHIVPIQDNSGSSLLSPENVHQKIWSIVDQAFCL